jgi:Pyridine nucleotide-disulphide oxidoreductase
MNTDRRPVAVVGAGPSGLGCAIGLAAHVPVVLVERIPVAGGSAGWENPEMRGHAARAAALGVELRLGQTAIRWSGHRLLVAGPGECGWLPARHLFVAAGLRPATAADLKLTGDRPAGVVPATVAEHLLDAGVALWRTVVVVGDGPWAPRVAERARRLGARIIAVGSDAAWADEHLDRPCQWRIVGRDRVQALRLCYEGAGPASIDVRCDAVVLAADPLPNRNIDGAVLPGSAQVTFVQPAAPRAAGERFDAARRAAGEWLEAAGEVVLA